MMQTSLNLVERRTLDPFTLFCVIFICVLSCLYFNLMCVLMSSKVNQCSVRFQIFIFVCGYCNLSLLTLRLTRKEFVFIDLTNQSL